VAELEAEAELGNIPYREAVDLKKRVGELEKQLQVVREKILTFAHVELDLSENRENTHGERFLRRCWVKQLESIAAPPAKEDGE